MKKEKGVAFHYVKYVVRSIVGFLFNVKYKESNQTEWLLVSKRLIQTSLNLDSYCVKLRAATFFLSNPKYIGDIMMKVSQELLKVNTTEESENIMKAILPMLYSSVKLKSLPENYDITQQNIVSIFRNITNIIVMVYSWT